MNRLPREGPRSGAEAKRILARPRSTGANRSATAAPALTRGAEPTVPARKRNIINVWIFWATAAPTLKMTSAVYVDRNTYCRPKSSESGAQNSGPIAKPRTKSEIPKTPTSDETLKVRTTSGSAPENAVLTKATMKALKACRKMMVHFFLDENALGFLSSIGRKSTMNGDWEVP